MTGSNKVNLPARDGQGESASSTEADATLDKDSVHSESSATPVDNNEMHDSVSSPAQGEQNADLSRSDLDAALAHYQNISDRATSLVQGEQSPDLDARLERVLKHYHGITTSADKNEMSESITSLAQGGHNADQPSIQLDATLERVLADLQESATPADSDDLSEYERVTSLVQSGLDAALARGREVSARLEQLLAHCLDGATPVHTPPPASMAYTREEVLTKEQSACPLFRLPPELRNTIYTYAFRSKYGMSPFQWDEEHDCPKITLKRAQTHAPSNELLRTCRSIYAEGKRIYVEAKTQYWSNTTFTLTLGARRPAACQLVRLSRVPARRTSQPHDPRQHHCTRLAAFRGTAAVRAQGGRQCDLQRHDGWLLPSSLYTPCAVDVR